jgi:hypothetical protein
LLCSDTALVLQYGSGPSSDFLAKILGLDTSWFLCNIQFYFPLSTLLVCKSSKRIASSVHHCSSVGNMYVYGGGDLGSVPKCVVFFNHQICNGCEGCKVSFFKLLHLFYFFLYSHPRMRGALSISQRVMTEIKFLLRNTFSECLIVDLTTSFHILTQQWFMFDLFFHGDRDPIKFVCVRLENSTLLGGTPSTGNDKDIVSCLLVLTECRSKHKF